jgi:4-amino-4-deoxy-L-arabinose transferase-like glycosyltransferase
MRTDKYFFTLIAFSSLFYYWVAFSSPIAFGDEAHYIAIGRWISQNWELPKYQPYWGNDYAHIPFSKLPIFYLFNSFFYAILGEFGVRLMIPLFALLSATILYLFFRRIDNPKAGLFSATILLMLPGFITYGVMDYVETSMVFLSLCSIFFFYFGLKEKNKKFLILSGIFFGFSALTDITGAFLGILLVLYFVFSRRVSEWKNFIVVFLAFILVVSPWFGRNLLLYNGFCYPFLPGKCEPKYDIQVETYGFKAKERPVPEIGTGAGIVRYGFLQYMRFAFGWIAAILLFFGLVYLFRNFRADLDLSLLILIWFLLFLTLTFHQAFFGGRTEDVPRYTLFGFPVVAIVCGLFTEKVHKFLKRYSKITGICFLIIFFILTFYFGFEKFIIMQKVRQFFPGYLEGCEWIRLNTPEDAVITAIYAHQAEYYCERKTQAIQNLPDTDVIRVFANDTSYEHLKRWGIDYIIIEQFTVSVQYYGETTPIKFLGYLENSDHFEKVFDNTNKYGQGGVKIFKILYNETKVG